MVLGSEERSSGGIWSEFSTTEEVLCPQSAGACTGAGGGGGGDGVLGGMCAPSLCGGAITG